MSHFSNHYRVQGYRSEDPYGETFLVSYSEVSRLAHEAFPNLPKTEPINIMMDLRLERLAAPQTDLLFRTTDIEEKLWPVLEESYGDKTSYNVLRKLIGKHLMDCTKPVGLVAAIERWFSEREAAGLTE